MEKWSIISNENDVMIRIKIIRKAVLKKKYQGIYMNPFFISFLLHIWKKMKIFCHTFCFQPQNSFCYCVIFLLIKEFVVTFCVMIMNSSSLPHHHQYLLTISIQSLAQKFPYKKDPRFCWKKKQQHDYLKLNIFVCRSL